MSVSLQFLGAAGTVTGSRYLLESGAARLLVDCGLFQGSKALRQRNWVPPAVPADEIDAVLLTHAHLDHSGALPLLVRQGFSGPIYATHPTADLVDNLLLDAANIQEHEADYANDRGFSKHRPAQPLFTVEDARRAIRALRPSAFHQPLVLGNRLSAQFRRSGHLLGAASILFSVEGESGAARRVLFSGDVGRPTGDLHLPPSRSPPSTTSSVSRTTATASTPTST